MNSLREHLQRLWRALRRRECCCHFCETHRAFAARFEPQPRAEPGPITMPTLRETRERRYR